MRIIKRCLEKDPGPRFRGQRFVAKDSWPKDSWPDGSDPFTGVVLCWAGILPNFRRLQFVSRAVANKAKLRAWGVGENNHLFPHSILSQAASRTGPQRVEKLGQV
jgi:hypothetical protein